MITQVVLLMDNPVGKVGAERQDVGEFPVSVGVSEDIAAFWLNVYGDPVYEIPGAIAVAVIVIFRVVVPVPAEFEAVITYAVDDCTDDGVPLMAQLEVFKVNPVGKVGELTQLVRGVAVIVGVCVEIAVFTGKENDVEE